MLTLYLEQYQLNEFTFGFEFEFFMPQSEQSKFVSLSEKYLNNISIDSDYESQFGSDPSLKLDECETCEGRGEIEEEYECQACYGTGTMFVCPTCSGDGQIIRLCPECKGHKTNLFDDSVCDKCDVNGRERIVCPTCDGDKKIDYEDHRELFNLYRASYDSNGKILNSVSPELKQQLPQKIERERCWDCSGHGYYYATTSCPECDGDGKGGPHGPYQNTELRTPPMRCNPISFGNAVKFLQASIDHNALVNDSCGFHVHIGFPDQYSRNEDIFWAFIQLATDKYYSRFMKLLNFNGISFVNEQYAYLDSLQSIMGTIERGEFDDVDDAISSIMDNYEDVKFSVIHLHKQGTLEWRGPRGFLNSEYGPDKIKKLIKQFFYNHLPKFIKLLSDCISEKYIDFGDFKLYKYQMDAVIQGLERPISEKIKKPKRESAKRKPFAEHIYTNPGFIQKIMAATPRIKELFKYNWFKDVEIHNYGREYLLLGVPEEEANKQIHVTEQQKNIFALYDGRLIGYRDLKNINIYLYNESTIKKSILDNCTVIQGSRYGSNKDYYLTIKDCVIKNDFNVSKTNDDVELAVYFIECTFDNITPEDIKNKFGSKDTISFKDKKDDDE